MKNFVFKFFRKKKLKDIKKSEFNITKLQSYEEYINYSNIYRDQLHNRITYEKKMIFDGTQAFVFKAYCFACKKKVDFLVDYQSAYIVDGIMMPNWRERLVCPFCRMNNRMRAALHIFYQECNPDVNSDIYITEQITPLFKWLQTYFPKIIGSEYYGNAPTKEVFTSIGIRNENVTNLSFDKNQFDYILSFDVFEHVFSYKEALEECFRCLRPGGTIVFSVPCQMQSEKNIVRAVLYENGKIKHLMSPEYHGDPLNDSGCLCFYHFGWELIDDLKSVGFDTANAIVYWSKEYGYLGREQVLFLATKPA